MMPQRPSRLRAWCKRICYSLLAVLLLVGLIYVLGWYGDWKEQRRLDEMLAELDRTESGWRWKDFLPTPSRPGQENGALRFIEFGKTIDPNVLEMPDEISKETLNYYDPPNWLEPPAVRKWLADLLTKTKELQEKIQSLVGLKRGYIPEGSLGPGR